MKTDHLDFPEYGWGYLPPCPEVYAAFEYCQKEYDPKNVLEIGFHLGHSTTYQLEIYKNAKIVTVSPEKEFGRKPYPEDIIHYTNRSFAAERMKRIYKERFTWMKGSTLSQSVKENLSKSSFDFALVDGSHTYSDAVNDLDLMSKLNLKLCLCDNLEKLGVYYAMKDLNWKVVKEFEYETNFKQKKVIGRIGVISHA